MHPTYICIFLCHYAVPGMYEGRPERYFDDQQDFRARKDGTVQVSRKDEVCDEVCRGGGILSISLSLYWHCHYLVSCGVLH